MKTVLLVLGGLAAIPAALLIMLLALAMGLYYAVLLASFFGGQG